MKLRELSRRQWVDSPQERVFVFCERAENLSRITPASLGFRVLTPSPVAMREGRAIDYRIRLAGVPVAWRSEIPVYRPPHRFVDRQLRGPYTLWHHRHRFESDGQRTCIVDRVRYVLPRWLPRHIEEVVHDFWVRPYLNRIFDYRAQVFSELFDTEKAALES